MYNSTCVKYLIKENFDNCHNFIELFLIVLRYKYNIHQHYSSHHFLGHHEYEHTLKYTV